MQEIQFYFAVAMPDKYGIGYYVGTEKSLLAVFNTPHEAGLFVAMMNLALQTKPAEA